MKQKLEQKIEETEVSEVEKIVNAFSNPVEFAKYFLNITPFDYQIPFLLCNSKRQIFKGGRKIGKTTMTAIKALFKAITEPEQMILIIAPTLEQAKISFDMIKNFIISNDFLASQVERMTLTMVFFKNKSQIFVRACGRTGFQARGYNADLWIVDEEAFIPDAVYNAIKPNIAARRGSIIEISTPFGKRGVFYQNYYSDEYVQFSAKTSECPLVEKSFLESEKKRMSEVEYLQEYEGEFVEEVDVFFPRDLILSCLEVEEEK